jgi:uncharacterized membrane protein
VKTTRPILQLPLSSREMLLEVASIVGVLTCIAMLVPVWKTIPQTVPSHFDLSGKADAMGSKSFLLIIPCIVVFMYVLMTAISRFPHIFNYPFPTTADNAERLYRMAREMMSWIKTLDIWMVTIMNWMLLQVATGRSTSIGSSIMIVVAALVVIQTTVLGLGVYGMSRAK